MLLHGALSKPKPPKNKKFLIFQELKFSCSNIEKIRIFSEGKAFLIFSEKKSCLIFLKMELCTSQPKHHKIKKIHPPPPQKKKNRYGIF